MQSILADSAKVVLQENSEYLINDIVCNGVHHGKAFKMRHDILIDHAEKGMFILDTKYKEIKRFGNSEDINFQLSQDIVSSDLYQVGMYAIKRGLDNVYLLYPLFRHEEDEPVIPALKTDIPKGSGRQITFHLVRLPFVFEDDVETVKKRLRNVINSLF